MNSHAQHSGNFQDLQGASADVRMPAGFLDKADFSASDITPPTSESDMAQERNAEMSGPPITMQPRSSGTFVTDCGSEETCDIATVEGHAWSLSNISRYVHLQGLEFLLPLDYLYIQQTIELQDLLTTVESENRYLVKTRSGETVYVAAEQSAQSQRQCCGSSRAFRMRLFDVNRQETLSFIRPLGTTACCFPCCLQQLEIFTPNGQIIGRVQQEWTLLIPEFFIQDSSGQVVYRLQGPNVCGCFMFNESDFKIMTKDGYTQVGNIAHSWDDFLHAYTVAISFPPQATVENKAVILGAAFLLIYLYFLKPKTKSCMRFCRIRL